MPCPNCSCPSCLSSMGSPIPPGPLPPPELIATNRAPTSSEVARSQDVINSTERMVSQIQAVVDDLAKQKVELLDLIQTHRTAISPLKCFPSELLAKIFADCIDMILEDRLALTEGTCPPLMFMGICSRWREIVLNTSYLWTKLVEIPPNLDFWIAQSKELPLRFQLTLSAGNRNHNSALKALIPHAHRWEDVYFQLNNSSNSDLAPARNRLHSLKTLELSFGHTTGTVDFCDVAPQLTEVRLQNMYEHVDIQLPWKQLQVCAIDNLRTAHYVLQHAENLRACYLDVMLDVMSKPPSPPWPSMPRSHSHHLCLCTLTITAAYSDIAKFLSSVTLPSLQILGVYFGYHDYGPKTFIYVGSYGSELASITFRFLERSSAQLRALTLTEIPFSEDTLIDCLGLVPFLVSLDIGYRELEPQNEIEDTLLGALNTNLPGYILPRLRSLTFRGPASVSEESLDALITSRRSINPNYTVALLENLTLGCPVQSSHWPPLFHRFVSEGLNIEYG